MNDSISVGLGVVPVRGKPGLDLRKATVFIFEDSQRQRDIDIKKVEPRIRTSGFKS